MGRLVGKYHATRALAQFVRYFHNWPELWRAYRRAEPLPSLRLRGGITIAHVPADNVIGLFREIFVDRCYTRPGFYDPKPSDTVLDIGANIGCFALYLQSYAPGIRVHCYEPADDTRGRLAQNVKANGLDPHIAVHPYAVSGSQGVAHLKEAAVAAQRSFFDSEFVDASSAEPVECVRLADSVETCDAEFVDLVKIDAEGAEIEIVEATEAQTWTRIRRLVFEFHDLFRPGCRERVTRVLAAHGFQRIEVTTFSPDQGLGIVQASR